MPHISLCRTYAVCANLNCPRRWIHSRTQAARCSATLLCEVGVLEDARCGTVGKPTYEKPGLLLSLVALLRGAICPLGSHGAYPRGTGVMATLFC